MTAPHVPYYNATLGALYCEGCGEEWLPCLAVRQEEDASRELVVRCLCGHVDIQHKDSLGHCNLLSCGCRWLRPAVAA